MSVISFEQFGMMYPVSDIRKYVRDLCFTFYLLLSSVAKLVGKNIIAADDRWLVI